MDDSTLYVDPEKLRRAGNALQNHHGDIRYELDRIHAGHADLQDTWHGAAADMIATSWKALHARLTTHADQLANHAQNLTTSANSFVGQDNSNADSFQESFSLDLPLDM